MTNYSSVSGFDMQNNEVYIDTVLSDQILEIFYAKKELFDPIDLGGGVFGIHANSVLNVAKTPAQLRRLLGLKTMTKDVAKEVYDALIAANSNRSYLL